MLGSYLLQRATRKGQLTKVLLQVASIALQVCNGNSREPSDAQHARCLCPQVEHRFCITQVVVQDEKVCLSCGDLLKAGQLCRGSRDKKDECRPHPFATSLENLLCGRH